MEDRVGLHVRHDGTEIGDGIGVVELEMQSLRLGFNLCVAPSPVKLVSQNLPKLDWNGESEFVGRKSKDKEQEDELRIKQSEVGVGLTECGVLGSIKIQRTEKDKGVNSIQQSSTLSSTMSILQHLKQFSQGCDLGHGGQILGAGQWLCDIGRLNLIFGQVTHV